MGTLTWPVRELRGTQGNSGEQTELKRSMNGRERAMECSDGSWMNPCSIDERLNPLSTNGQDAINRTGLLRSSRSTIEIDQQSRISNPGRLSASI
jgi:hypothetical protein